MGEAEAGSPALRLAPRAALELQFPHSLNGNKTHFTRRLKGLNVENHERVREALSTVLGTTLVASCLFIHLFTEQILNEYLLCARPCVK